MLKRMSYVFKEKDLEFLESNKRLIIIVIYILDKVNHSNYQVLFHYAYFDSFYYTVEEIATRMHYSYRTIQRKLQTLHDIICLIKVYKQKV